MASMLPNEVFVAARTVVTYDRRFFPVCRDPDVSRETKKDTPEGKNPRLGRMVALAMLELSPT